MFSRVVVVVLCLGTATLAALDGGRTLVKVVLDPWSLRGVAAQTAPADPIVKENVTVKLAPHTYAIPDGNVGLVPNVGIIVGSRATLVIDPGLGKRNGEAEPEPRDADRGTPAHLTVVSRSLSTGKFMRRSNNCHRGSEWRLSNRGSVFT